MKIIDAHTHAMFPETGSPHLYKLLKQLDIYRVNIMSVQCAGLLTQNVGMAALKFKNSDMTYAFAGLDHVSGRDYLTQIKAYYDMGFDGLKILEAKPAIRKQLGLALDDERLDPLYSFMEEKEFPILMHIADPATFWDEGLCPDWAKENGWFYDDSYVPFEQYYEEVDNLLYRHPKLRAIFAHFYFLSDNPDRMQKFLDNHPAVFTDLTAGVEMYENFSKDPDFWRSFFIKNADRIIFGTDSTDEELKEGAEYTLNSNSAMELDFLRTDKVFDHFGMTIRGINLPDDVLKKILHDNYYSLVGEPRKLDIDLVVKEAEYIRDFIKDTDELKIMDSLVKQLA